jgi:hypothetical protein
MMQRFGGESLTIEIGAGVAVDLKIEHAVMKRRRWSPASDP